MTKDNSKPDQRECYQCGSLFTPKQRRSIVCDNSRCRNRHAAGSPPLKDIKPVECVVCGDSFLPDPHPRRNRCDSCLKKKCGYCGNTFRPNHPSGKAKGNETQVYCSIVCRDNARHQRKVESWLEENSGAFSPVFHKTCRECGDNLGARPTAIVCSYDCTKARNARYRWAQDNGFDDIDSDECRAAYAEGFNYRKCKSCGVYFRLATHSMSDECALCYKKRHRVRRRHRIRAERRGVPREPYDPINDVIKRDGQKCYICGIDTPLSLRGTIDPQAPEVDHIWPLARGGPDTLNNVACACRRCNQAKSDGVITAQQPGDVLPEQVVSAAQIKTAVRLFIEPNMTQKLSEMVERDGYGSVAFWLQPFEVDNGATQTAT